jgi:hypothetical protein
MTRRVFTIASVSSAVLCAAAGIIWIASSSATYGVSRISRAPEGSRIFFIASWHGRICIEQLSLLRPLNHGWLWSRESDDPYILRGLPAPLERCSRAVWLRQEWCFRRRPHCASSSPSPGGP